MTPTIFNPQAAKLLLAINTLAKGYIGRPNVLHVYAGTVPEATIAKRRAASKAARKARRAGRS